jgi:multidrug resistance efflux pump
MPGRSQYQQVLHQSLADERWRAALQALELAVQRATARQPEIDAALADIVIAQASLDNANANLEKTILRAPADGTVTRVNIKIGEVPEANKEAIGLQDVSNLYLEAKVNETSVPHLVVGQPVTVTFEEVRLAQDQRPDRHRGRDPELRVHHRAPRGKAGHGPQSAARRASHHRRPRERPTKLS